MLLFYLKIIMLLLHLGERNWKAGMKMKIMGPEESRMSEIQSGRPGPK